MGSSERLGKKVIEFRNISKKFGDLRILNDFSFCFERDSRIGIIGHNGVGKSSFLNIISEQIKADSGEIEYGETVNLGYYKQDGLILNENKKVIEIITDIAENVEIQKGHMVSASVFLTQFLFPPSVQNLPVMKLSGGEKKRLYLLTILVKRPNFLILDEPSNDLDIQTLNILEDYVENLEGAVIIVSHDRFFIDKLVNKLFIFEGDGEVSVFEGNYSDYNYYLKQTEKEKKISNSEGQNNKDKIQRNKAKLKLSFNERNEFESLTTEIADLEKEKSALEEILNSGTSDHELLKKSSEKISEILKLIDEKEMRWLELSEKNS